MLSLIVAATENNVIGNQGDIPWKLTTDLRRFAQITKGHSVIMGRKTYDSIIARLGKPLPERKNIVITRQKDFSAPGAIVCHSLAEALELSKEKAEVFVIGGAQLYSEALPLTKRLYLTRVHTTISGDTFFPEIKESEWTILNQEEVPADEKNQYSSTFLSLEKK